VCGYLIEHPPGLVGAGYRRTDRVITVDARYSRPPPVSDQERHTTWGVAPTVRTIPSVPGSSGVASAADAVVGVTMTSSRFINR
jgi:hypothetical protein